MEPTESPASLDLRAIPIPSPTAFLTTEHYHQQPYRASALSNEALVRPCEAGLLCNSYYAIENGTNPPYGRPIQGALKEVWCRESVAEKLLAVNRSLAAYHVQLMLLDGFRTLECQRDLWQFFHVQTRSENPALGDEALDRIVSQYCSRPVAPNPADPETWPTHCTGAAIDVTLCSLDSAEALDLGSPFDDAHPVSHSCSLEDDLRVQTDDAMRDKAAARREAARNRRLLYWSMTLAGFANYPFEWWHFDWGNQMWLQNRLPGQPGTEAPERAWYGCADFSLHRGGL
ncbi:MAG: hypothetical protein HYV27_22675 [Candidatus Hydrogenedentes bacterium]|nr:hypothetical protein [Candidatus Hydrogenedentota bacterium]